MEAQLTCKEAHTGKAGKENNQQRVAGSESNGVRKEVQTAECYTVAKKKVIFFFIRNFAQSRMRYADKIAKKCPILLSLSSIERCCILVFVL